MGRNMPFRSMGRGSPFLAAARRAGRVISSQMAEASSLAGVAPALTWHKVKAGKKVNGCAQIADSFSAAAELSGVYMVLRQQVIERRSCHAQELSGPR